MTALPRVLDLLAVARAFARSFIGDGPSDLPPASEVFPTLADIEEDRDKLGEVIDEDVSEGLAVLVEDLRAEANAADERTAAVTRTNDQLRDELTVKARELEELRKASGYVVAQRTRLWLVLAAIRIDCGQLVRDAEALVAGGWKPESEGV